MLWVDASICSLQQSLYITFFMLNFSNGLVHLSIWNMSFFLPIQVFVPPQKHSLRRYTVFSTSITLLFIQLTRNLPCKLRTFLLISIIFIAYLDPSFNAHIVEKYLLKYFFYVEKCKIPCNWNSKFSFYIKISQNIGYHISQTSWNLHKLLSKKNSLGCAGKLWAAGC